MDYEKVLLPIERLLAILNSLLLLLTILGSFYPESFLVDLFGNFLVQTLLLALCGAGLFLVRRRGGFFLVSLALFLLKLEILYPYINVSEPPKDLNSIKVMVSNVHGENTYYQEVIDGIKLAAPDVLAIVEVNSEWERHLAEGLEEYSYSEAISREDNFGLALYSKFPLADIFKGPIQLGEPPIIRASIEREGVAFDFFLVHTVPPGGNQRFDLRNKELKELSLLINERGRPSILLGDLNTTPWSAHFKSLLSEAGLTDPRRSFGILPSWTQEFFPFLIPIDHILISKKLSVSNLRLHTTPGSDHRALIAHIMSPG